MITRRYALYLLRWQLSTPILAVCVMYLWFMNSWMATMIANLVGGLIFFWVDRFIFTSEKVDELWKVAWGTCFDCGKSGRLYRLVKSAEYDKVMDSNPEWRCEQCSDRKFRELQKEWECR